MVIFLLNLYCFVWTQPGCLDDTNGALDPSSSFGCHHHHLITWHHGIHFLLMWPPKVCLKWFMGFLDVLELPYSPLLICLMLVMKYPGKIYNTCLPNKVKMDVSTGTRSELFMNGFFDGCKKCEKVLW